MAPGFAPVADAFDGVLAGTRGGAAFSVVRHGTPLVELHGGTADPDTGRPWTADTTAVLFSGTKGLTAMVCALLAARGLLDPDARVAEYWPEFAAGGKGETTVAQVLAHTAGLPYVERDAEIRAADVRNNAAALAEQTPLWEPGSRVAYHALTYGHLADELMVRSTGLDAPALVARELDGLDGVTVRLRTPDRHAGAMARIVRSPDYRISTFLDDPERRKIVDRMYGTLLTKGDPGAPAAARDDEVFNTRGYRLAGLAAASAVGNASSMARLYGMLADPSAPLVPAPALARATRTHAEGKDAVNDRPLHYGLGFELADPIGTYGPAPVAFGHSGAGGGRHGAWPEHELGFSFVINEMCSEDTDDRATRLLQALHDCL